MIEPLSDEEIIRVKQMFPVFLSWKGSKETKQLGSILERSLKNDPVDDDDLSLLLKKSKGIWFVDHPNHTAMFKLLYERYSQGTKNSPVTPYELPKEEVNF